MPPRFGLYDYSHWHGPIIGRLEGMEMDFGSGGFTCTCSISDEARDILLGKKEAKMANEGKILIKVDEKNPNRVVAKNLLTGDEAVAKCSPDDKFDFMTGAKMALDRLSKVKKYWTGRVVCIKANDGTNRLFTPGMVYQIIDGVLKTNRYSVDYGNNFKVTSVDDLNKCMKKLPSIMISGEFIEYKGGAD